MKLFVNLFIFLFISHLAQAQTTASVLTKNETDSLIVNYCKLLNENYFNKEVASKVTSSILKKWKKGDFYNQTQLTDRLSFLLREITHDKHFYIGQKVANDLKESVGEIENNSDDKLSGFSEVRLLEGEIGYIKWDEFNADEQSLQRVVAAFEFLKGCKYLIFDLTECPGGDGRMGGFVNCHLFESDEYQDLLLKKCTNETAWHQSEVPYNYSNGPKFYDIPIYVLISGNTASAAEYFAWNIQEMNRGIVLGQTTAGAGNPVSRIDFGNFFAYIPICEIVTKDGKSIEGKGVVPTVKLNTNNWLEETLLFIKNS